MFKLWPNRSGWSADCNEMTVSDDPKNAWHGGRARRWSHKKEMWANDYFTLHIKKPRVISRIKFFTELPRFPKKFKLYIRSCDDSNWEELGEYTDEDLDIILSPPRKLISLKVTITEPREERWPNTGNPIAWSIYDIELTEVRLFGKWWRKVIGE